MTSRTGLREAELLSVGAVFGLDGGGRRCGFGWPGQSLGLVASAGGLGDYTLSCGMVWER